MRSGYLESLGEIRHKIQTGGPKARRMLYKGYRFRSKLEARFAWHLDDIGERWRYEPAVYGPRGRGYLPDFEILDTSRPTFIEVKPKLDQVEAAKKKMAVIWDTHPDALLVIACREEVRYFAALRDVPWETWQERWPG